MKMTIKQFIKNIFPAFMYTRVKNYHKAIHRYITVRAIKQAVREQGLSSLADTLAEIVPDLTYQYSEFKVDNEYLIKKVRAVHAFQMYIVKKAIELLGKSPSNNKFTIVDIGDSCGTHIQYIKRLFSDYNIHSISLNLDEGAVKRIRKKGLEAICANAQEWAEKKSIDADIFMCFETLEHLLNPTDFLHKLSTGAACKLFVITVPYVKSSRVGLHQIRNSNRMKVTAENTHLFELSPECWQLLFQFSGWRVLFSKIYLQYPRRHWLYVTKPFWKRYDFEGFYGAILTKDHTWCDLYKDW